MNKSCTKTTDVYVDVPVYQPAWVTMSDMDGIHATLADPITANEAEEPLTRPAETVQNTKDVFCTFPPANIDKRPNLELIQICSAGYSQLFGLKLVDRGIRACNAAGAFDTAIAEWNVAMMVNLARNLRQMIRNQDTRVWDRGAEFQKEIRGSTVGLWGYGSIGRQTARLCKILGMNVHVLEPNGVVPRPNTYCVEGAGDQDGVLPDRVFNLDERESFLGGLDFLILGMPLTNNTEGIIGDAELQALPRHAYLLNPARGPLIKEQSLIRALSERWIAGAALDTHYHYPMPPDHPLWAMDNVILTPHISGSTGSPFFHQRIWDIFLQNVQRYQSGQPLLNELSPSQLNGG